MDIARASHRNRSDGDLELQGELRVPPTISEQVGLSHSRSARDGSVSEMAAQTTMLDDVWCATLYVHGGGGFKSACKAGITA